ncbi:MAG: hypothetical protein V7641_1370 [Blastocatellia bacterium]
MPIRQTAIRMLRSFIILLSSAGLALAQATSSKPELVLQTGHTGPVNAIALSGDGRVLISASDDNTLKIWDTATGNVLRTLYGHAQPVLAVALSPDGRLIASGGEDLNVRVWDVATGEARVFGQQNSSVKELAFSGDGQQLVSLGSNELKVWNVASGREIRSTKLGDDKDNSWAQTTGGPRHRYDQTATALTIDGRLAAVGGGITYKSGVLGVGGGVRQKPIRLIESTSGREIESFKLKGDLPTPTDLSFSPDGRLLVAKFTELGAARKQANQSSIVVFDVASGREVKTLQTGDLAGTGGIAFSPDGKLLASRVSVAAATPANSSTPTALGQLPSGSIKLLDVATWQEVRELKKTGFGIDLAGGLTATPLRFSSDGKMIAASLNDGVGLFDSASGNSLRVLRTTEKASVVSAAQSTQSARDDMLRQSGVDPDELRQIREMAGGMLGPNSPFGAATTAAIGTGSTVNFSPDGKLLSTAGSSTLWDVTAGLPRSKPQNYNDALSRLLPGRSANSPDGKLIATVDLQSPNIVVKDAASGQIVRQITIAGSSGNQRSQVPLQIGSLAFGVRGIVVQYYEIKTSSRPSLLGGGGGGMEGHVKTFDAGTGKELRDVKLDSNDGGMFGMMANASTLSPDGRYLVGVTADAGGGGFGGFRPSLPRLPGMGRKGGDMPKQTYKIKLTDLDSGRKVWEIKVEGENIAAAPGLIFSPSGSVLAVTSYDKDQPVINLYDAASGRRFGALNTGEHRIARMNFNSDATLLATSYGDNSQGAMVMSRTSNKAGKPAFSGGDNLVTVWEVASGKPLFTLTHDAPVSGVAFNPARKLIATQTQDRNLHLWGLPSGEKLLTLVNLDALNEYGGGNDWLVVTPDGLFDGSPAAWQQIMWRFSQNTFDIGPVEIFFNDLFYPGLLSDINAGKRPTAPRDFQKLDRRQPKVKVTLKQAASGDIQARTVTVQLEISEAPADATHAQPSGARDVRLFRNGSLVKVWHGDVLKGQPQAVLEATLPIVAGENRLTAYAFNQDNVKSADAFLSLAGAASLRRKGTAYVVAFGVNQYENAQYNLKYAAADAMDFAEEIKTQQTKLGEFAGVEIISLLDKEATKANLLLALKRLTDNAALPGDAPQELSKLRKAEPEDAVVIYFAGHGTARGARFYLVPHDLGYTGPRAGIDADAVEKILAHSVSDLELEAAVEGLDAGQMLLVIDACNSGQALEAEEKRRGPMNSKGLAQLAYEKGLYILTAAQSYQAALEAAQLGHGYLTFALVEEGLKSDKADREQKDGRVLVREWFNYATERVPEMQEQNNNSRLLLEEDDKAKDVSRVRNLQRPRAFYRREAEASPFVIARP